MDFELFRDRRTDRQTDRFYEYIASPFRRGKKWKECLEKQGNNSKNTKPFWNKINRLRSNSCKLNNTCLTDSSMINKSDEERQIILKYFSKNID